MYTEITGQYLFTSQEEVKQTHGMSTDRTNESSIED
jgi:hypothetical protein